MQSDGKDPYLHVVIGTGQHPGCLPGLHSSSQDAVFISLIFGVNIFQGSLVPKKPFHCRRFSCHGRDTKLYLFGGAAKHSNLTAESVPKFRGPGL